MKLLKKDFPFFSNNPNLVYADNAATTQKPQQVIDRINHFYTHENAPVYRGVYALAEQATTHFEAVRTLVKDFIGAADASEIIFMPNATAGINLVARAWAKNILQPGDEIVLTELEHHSNLVPWLQVAQETGAVIKYIPVLKNGDLDYTNLEKTITAKTKIVAATALSNVTGAEVDLKKLQERAHEVGAAILVDACQSALRRKINVQAQKIDFLVFSGPKILGPTGIGVLFAKRKFHEQMTPFYGGGGAVLSVDYDRVAWRTVPQRFEVGTPDTAAVLGLGAAIEYIQKNIDQEKLTQHEAGLCKQLIQGLQGIGGVTFLGPTEQLMQRGFIVSFVMDGMHAQDVATYLDKQNIAVRAGHHCAQPLHTKFGIAASVRVSFCCYSTAEDVERILAALGQLKR